MQGASRAGNPGVCGGGKIDTAVDGVVVLVRGGGGEGWQGGVVLVLD